MLDCNLGYIENCVFNGKLEKVTINKVTRPFIEYQLHLPEMENTTIEEIVGDNSIQSVISNSYIKLITDVTELKYPNLIGCSIVCLLNLEIQL